MKWIKIALLISLAAFMATLVLLHVAGVNGPFYWKWKWRELSPLPLYGGMLLAVIPFFAAQFLNREKLLTRWLALSLLVISCFGMKVAAAITRTDFDGLNLIRDIVVNPHISGYYLDATRISDLPLRQWMGRFASDMPYLTMHAQSKPPGPILYWYTCINLFGKSDQTAIVGGLMLGLLAAMGIPATHWFLRRLLRDEHAAFCGASFMALSPGFVLFFPMLDPAYVLLSTAMIGFWWIALTENRTLFSVLTGIVIALVLLCAFNVLVAGLFMAGLILLTRQFKVAFRQALIVAGSAIAVLIAMRILIGYDPISTFLMAWTNQHALLAQHADQRPYPATILFDLLDFSLGVGWIGFLIVALYFTSKSSREHRRLALLAIAQIVIVAITGLLQSETSRVWNFLLPLLMIPVGLELGSWNRNTRLVCYAALATLTAVIYQNMTFLL